MGVVPYLRLVWEETGERKLVIGETENPDLYQIGLQTNASADFVLGGGTGIKILKNHPIYVRISWSSNNSNAKTASLYKVEGTTATLIGTQSMTSNGVLVFRFKLNDDLMLSGNTTLRLTLTCGGYAACSSQWGSWSMGYLYQPEIFLPVEA